jgi:hypothetical protein
MYSQLERLSVEDALSAAVTVLTNSSPSDFRAPGRAEVARGSWRARAPLSLCHCGAPPGLVSLGSHVTRCIQVLPRCINLNAMSYNLSGPRPGSNHSLCPAESLVSVHSDSESSSPGHLAWW